MERTAKHLVDEVKVSGPVCCSTTMCSVTVFNIYSFLQGAMKTAKYRKRCFDQIEGIVAENKTWPWRWTGFGQKLERKLPR